MNDFDYEVLCRKRLARQAQYVKRGSKSKKCDLPSDRLTHAQWKKRNGEVMEFNLKAPMTWSEFKSMPFDLQTEYIKRLHTEYRINATSLAQMFEVGAETVRSYCRERLGIQFHRGNMMSKTQREMWEDFLTAPESPEPKIDSVAEIAESKPESDISETESDFKMRMRDISMRFSGALDVDAISNTLRHVLAGNPVGTITINCDFGTGGFTDV